MSTHIAEFNWGVLKAHWDHPLVREFVDNLDRVNGIARRSKGFVWRMPNDEMEAAQAEMHEIGPVSRVASTLSVWESFGHLDQFVHKTLHAKFMARRDEWFEVMERPQYVLWTVPAGHLPSVHEAYDRRNHLKAHGPTPEAFDFAFARHLSFGDESPNVT